MSVQSQFGQGIARRIRATIALRTRLRDAKTRTFGFGRGLYVVGMHRSGTSAAARVVNLLGVPLGDPRDLIEADLSFNPKGHWESSVLAVFNDRILGQFGGTWSAPPQLPFGWEHEERVNVLAGEARRTFATVYSEPRWVWKDPRLCLTLPFWRSVLRAVTAAILVVRHPLEVAQSLEARNGLRLVNGLALWELYNRQAMHGLAGMPVFVTTYDALLRDPVAWSASVAQFIESAGIPVVQPHAEALDDFIDHRLRHTALGPEALQTEPVAGSHRELYQTLLDLAGTHTSFRMPAFVSA